MTSASALSPATSRRSRRIRGFLPPGGAPAGGAPPGDRSRAGPVGLGGMTADWGAVASRPTEAAGAAGAQSGAEGAVGAAEAGDTDVAGGASGAARAGTARTVAA